MSQQIRRNHVQIQLTANNYYIQLPKSQRDVNSLQPVTIAPMQIKKVEIFKSYQHHLTDIIVEIDNLDETVAVRWAEGKYIARLTISSADDGGAGGASENYFTCYNMEMIDTPAEQRIYGIMPTAHVVVVLKSITRARLEVENNFTYELGGKNGGGAAGVGQPPLGFLYDDLMELYSRNYMEAGDEGAIPWNMTYCDKLDPTHQVRTTPPNGYKIITDTNLEAMDFFFKHYPLFNTPYDYILDDFSSFGNITQFRISDFAWWRAWEPSINREISDLVNKEINAVSDGDRTFISMATMRYFRIQKLESKSFHDWFVFHVKNNYPKIWAVDVSSGKPIPMNAWNAIHEEAPVMTPNGNIKIIKNPMYKEFITFMTPKEIMESQLFRNVFQNLHPHLEKWTFSNVHIGDVDIHTIIELKSKMSADSGQIYDRLGMGYQVLHTYTREDLQPKQFTDASAHSDADPMASQFAYTFALTTECVFLTIDKGDLTIPSIGNEDANKVQAVITAPSTLSTDDCAGSTDASAVGHTGGGVVGGGTSGVGIPGNNSIADQGEAMVKAGFKYVYGGTAEHAMDCSAFTQKAVTRSGISGYPRSTRTQLMWCRRSENATKIDSYENIQRGDIILWKTTPSKGGHTAIALGGNQYAHANSGSPRRGTISTFSAYRYNSRTEIFRLKGGS